MNNYDSEVTPDPAEWLALDEQERVRLVEAYHLAAQISLPNTAAHAAMHVVVENLIAQQQGNVAQVMANHQKDGMTRHEALHAIAKVIATSMIEMHNANVQQAGQPT
jgi:hypothetical protein